MEAIEVRRSGTHGPGPTNRITSGWISFTWCPLVRRMATKYLSSLTYSPMRRAPSGDRKYWLSLSHLVRGFGSVGSVDLITVASYGPTSPRKAMLTPAPPAPASALWGPPPAFPA